MKTLKKAQMKSSILLVLICIIVATSTVYARGSYNSTYNMTGGVFSRNISAKKYITTTIVPKDGTLDGSIGVILAKKHWYGWDGPIKNVNSATGGTVTHKCNGTYKIWLRNFTTMRVTGNVSFDWK